jgi:glycosyltransferase involved in cell wall biosynthesis
MNFGADTAVIYNNSMRKKVLYVITAGDTGGAQKYVRDLASHLNPEQFESKILYGGKDMRWLSNHVSPFLFWNDWLAIAELVAVFHRERPNVIHLNSSKAGVVGSLAASLYRVTCHMSHVTCPRVIFTAHGWVFNPTNYYPPLVRWCHAALHRFAALFQDTIINVSEHDRNLALRHHIAPPKKLITIHNGIDPTAISFLSKEEARKEIAEQIRSQLPNYQLPITGNWVGSIGRLTREKDYGTLIAAAQEIPDVHFFVIGDGPEKENLKSQISNLKLENRFFLVPPTGTDAVLLKAFDIFTLCSIKEGLPYTLLEAMAAELPVVVTDAGGMREVVQVMFGEESLVALRGNKNDLAKTIVRALNQRKHGGQLKFKTRETFSLARMVRATETVYRS